MSSGENLSNSSCHFRKYKLVFLQILHQYSVPSNITPLYFFSSKILYFGQKQLNKVEIFEIFECSGENLPKSLAIFQTTREFFFKFYMTFQCHERELLYTFLGQRLSTLHKRDQSKCKFWRLLSARIKIHEILVNFETTNWFFFKFCINLQYHET